MAFKVFSTFTGIGGFELGIHHAARNILGEGIKHIDIVGYSEIDKPAISVYEYHFKGAMNYGDITKINTDELPDFDCLVGGFPCQAFSIAGKRKGFDDTRGTLFFDLARILRAKQPRLFVFENVKGLLNHDSGRTFKTIISTIDELGYDCQWQVLNSKNFGVPQNRERIIIVGHLRATTRPEVFPIRDYTEQTLKQIIGGSQGNRVYDTSGIACTQASQAGGLGAKTGLYISRIDRKNSHYDIKETEISGTLTATMYKGIDASGRTGIKEESRIRRLTPLECERLQAFPDNWTKFDVNSNEISDTQRYKMCGNAVTTNVIQAVFERIFSSNG